MDKLVLHLLTRQDHVERAIGSLDAAGVCAVALDDDGLLSLVWVGSLGFASLGGATFLGEIRSPEREQLGTPSDDAIRAAAENDLPALPGGPPDVQQEKYYGLIEGRNYSGFRQPNQTAFIFTRTEQHRAAVKTPRRKCSREPRHLFPRPDVAVGAICPHCVTTSGPPPTVS